MDGGYPESPDRVLPSVSFDERCAICLTEPIELEPSLLLPCLHTFCLPCIAEWLEQSSAGTCPLCKASVSSIIHGIVDPRSYSSIDLAGSDSPKLAIPCHPFRVYLYSRKVESPTVVRSTSFTGEAYVRNFSSLRSALEPFVRRELETLLSSFHVTYLVNRILDDFLKRFDLEQEKEREAFVQEVSKAYGKPFPHGKAFGRELLNIGRWVLFRAARSCSRELYDKAQLSLIREAADDDRMSD